jgi:hypothetical protein
VGVLVGFEGLFVLPQRAGDGTQHVVERVLLAAIALAALLDEELGQRLGLRPALFGDVLADEGEGSFLVVVVALQRQLVGLDAEIVLVQRLVAKTPEPAQEFGALAGTAC